LSTRWARDVFKHLRAASKQLVLDRTQRCFGQDEWIVAVELPEPRCCEANIFIPDTILVKCFGDIFALLVISWPFEDVTGAGRCVNVLVGVE